MMPPEEPDTGSHKIVFEIDYGHFVTLHGYLYGLQVVSVWVIDLLEFSPLNNRQTEQDRVIAFFGITL